MRLLRRFLDEAIHTPNNALSLNEELILMFIAMKTADARVSIPSERTVYRVMEEIHINHRSKRKPNGITKADKEAPKLDDLIKRDFAADKPIEKCITDMREIKALDRKLYVSAIFDCLI